MLFTDSIITVSFPADSDGEKRLFMKFKVYKGKYAFSWQFWPILALTVAPFLKNGFTGVLVVQASILALLILLAFSDIAARKLPNYYCLALLVLGIFKAFSENMLFERAIYCITLYVIAEILNIILNLLRKRRGDKSRTHSAGGGDTNLYALSGILLGYDGLMAICTACVLQILYYMLRKGKDKRIILGPFWSVSIYMFMLLQ